MMKRPNSRRAVLVMAIAAAVAIVMLLSISTGSVHKMPSNVKNSKDFSVKYESSPRHRENLFSSEGYIIAGRFMGQQGASTRGVLSLQCWAASFSLPVRIVDPCIDWIGGKLMSEFMDLEHFNAVSQLANEPLIATWEEFSSKLPRDVIAVQVNKSQRKKCDRLYSSELDIDDNVSSHSVAIKEDCLNPKHVGFYVPTLNKYNYCLKRVVTGLSIGCCSNDYREIIDIIYRGRDARKFTVIFVDWSPKFECQSPDSLHRINCSDPLKTKFKKKIAPSKQLVDDAKYYTDHFLHSQNSIAVMIRPVQAVIRLESASADDKIKLLENCLQNTVDIAHNISETVQHSGERGILLAVDVGRYGTQAKATAQRILGGRLDEVIGLVKHAFVNIYRNRWTFEEYEESFTIATKDNKSPAYIAALQRTLASQADCLILMGGGNFQLIALHDYLQKHPNPCVHFVCLDEYYESVARLAMQL